jgi:hypothetical protein
MPNLLLANSLMGDWRYTEQLNLTPAEASHYGDPAAQAALERGLNDARAADIQVFLGPRL